jgi:NitT/TauT family transport system substrate-binding protein
MLMHSRVAMLASFAACSLATKSRTRAFTSREMPARLNTKIRVDYLPRIAANFVVTVTILIACAFAPPRAVAEQIKIGVLKTTGSAPAFIGQEKGYFARAGLSSQLVFFESAQPVAVAVASGDIDFGYTGFAGGFYSLAGQGALRIVAGGAREVPGVNYLPFVASNRGYDSGLRSLKDFPGHSVGLSQVGSPPHYALALLSKKYGLDLKSVRIMPLQSIPNIASAIIGGQIDSGMMPGNIAVPMIQRGDAKLLGWVGDETPYQLVGLFVSTKTANERHELVERCLGALRDASHDYNDAFIDAGGKRRDGATAAETIAILAKYTGQSVADVALSIPYVDPDGRLDVKDVLRQIDWYKSQGVVKGEIDGNAIIDKHYVIPLTVD